MANGVELIARERERQKVVEGYTDEHDDHEHDVGDLARAGLCYENATPDAAQRHSTPYGFPWAAQWWKPKDRLSNLIRAGALYQAEIDRLSRKLNDMARLIDQELNGSAKEIE